MKAKFVDMGHSMDKYRCLTLQGGTEQVFAGKRGEIWSNGPQAYKAVFATRNREGEKIISFSSKDLKRQLLRLEVPSDPKDQLIYANNPNLRLAAN